MTYEAQVAGCVPLVSTRRGRAARPRRARPRPRGGRRRDPHRAARPARPEPRDAPPAPRRRHGPRARTQLGGRRAESRRRLRPRRRPSQQTRSCVPTPRDLAVIVCTRNRAAMLADALELHRGRDPRRGRGRRGRLGVGRRRRPARSRRRRGPCTCAATSGASRSLATSGLDATDASARAVHRRRLHRRRRVDRSDPRAVRRSRRSAPSPGGCSITPSSAATPRPHRRDAARAPSRASTPGTAR